MVQSISFQSICTTCVILLSFQSVGLAQNWLIDYLLPENYNNEIPPLENGTVLVNSTIDIFTFRIVNGERNFRADLTLCLKWHDNRLLRLNFTQEDDLVDSNGERIDGHYPRITVTNVDRFWSPEVYFRNSVSSQLIRSLQDIQYMEIWPDTKLVRYCSRMRVYFECLLMLSNFPFDQNWCYFELENLQRMRLNMENITTPNGNSQVRVMHRFVGMCQPTGLNTFVYEQNDMSNVFNNQSCTYAAVRIVRHINYYVIRYYAPCVLLMCIALLGSWVPTIAWPGRTIYTATVLLTITRVSITGYNEVPARDVVSLYWWFWGVQCFVYLCLVQYAYALLWVQYAFEKNKSRANNTPSPDGHWFGHNSWYTLMGDRLERFLHAIFGPIDFQNDPQGRNKVDYMGRVILPSTMLLFIFTYICCCVSAWATKYRYY